MRKTILRKCKACKQAFKTRNSKRIFCLGKACTKARRAVYLKKYMVNWKKKHPHYWKNAKQLEYLKRWRQAHPEYFSAWRKGNNRRRRIK
ncbi:MAG: hypothetical protein HZA48_09850 [Planctomycetes bacterium]|nr:hypothetical protein [Planctomycetota bacterium]